MDIIPCKLVRQAAALFTKTYLQRIVNLERDTVISADTLVTYVISDMVDHVTALRILKERFELSRLHLLALQRCNKQCQLGRASATSRARVKSVALTLEGFHINSWLYRLVKLIVNLQRFPDAYNLEKREVENSVYTLLLTLDPSNFDDEEIFLIWELTALCSCWTQIEAMVEHFSLRDALEMLSSEQFAELLSLLCNVRHNGFTPEDQEAFVQLKARYPTLTWEEEHAEERERRRKERETRVQAYSWERTRSNPVMQSMCVGDEVEAFLQDKCAIVSQGYRLLREVIGEKYAWERCIEVLRDTSVDAMFARERIISILPVLASTTQFWPSVELDPNYTNTSSSLPSLSEQEEEYQKEQIKTLEAAEAVSRKVAHKSQQEEELQQATSKSAKEDGNGTKNSSSESTNTNIDVTTKTTTVATTESNKEGITPHEINTNNILSKSVNKKVRDLFYNPLVLGTPGRGARLYSELPWLFDEKSWRSYFPATGSNALHELYTVNINQFALRLITVYGGINVKLPNYVRESYEKPIENNLWRHINERDLDTIGLFALFSVRRYDLIHAPFVFSEQLRKHMEHVVRDRWGVVISNAKGDNYASDGSQETNNESSSTKVTTSTNKNNNTTTKAHKENVTIESEQCVVTTSKADGNDNDNHQKAKEEEEERNDKSNEEITHDVNDNGNQEELLNTKDDKVDAEHDNEIKEVHANSNSKDNNAEETAVNKEDNKMDSASEDNKSHSVSKVGLNDEMEEEAEPEALSAHAHAVRQRELREQRAALRRLSRATHHHILKTLLLAIEVRCSVEVIKPLLQTLIHSMQQILKPSTCQKWNALYAQRVPLAQNESSIDWRTIEALIDKAKPRTSTSTGTMNNALNNKEINSEINTKFNNNLYVSSDSYDRPIDLEWSMWSFAHTAYALTMIESCFHGKPNLPTDIRGMFYKLETNDSNHNSSDHDVFSKTMTGSSKSDLLVESFPPLMDVKCDAEAAAMKAQISKLCLASLHGAIATDRITARSMYSILVCAPQTLREMKMMYEFLSLAALHARDGFSRSQLFYFVHADHIFEADEKWRRHMLRVALDLPQRMWM